MIEDEWLEQRVGTAYTFNASPKTQLLETCVQNVLEMIRRYRPRENPEDYRSIIEEKVKFRISRDEEK